MIRDIMTWGCNLIQIRSTTCLIISIIRDVTLTPGYTDTAIISIVTRDTAHRWDWAQLANLKFIRYEDNTA